jgi:uncharacterized protein (DUF2336 family)
MNTNLAMENELPVILTPSDVERLLKDDSPESRVEVLEKVSGHYNRNGFATRERDIAEQIFRLLMKDAALRVRETLSQRLKENEAIPRDIALHMAHDVNSVSLPILEASSVFSDADLVSIVESSGDLEKLMVISKRDYVSERVSNALVETSYPQIVSSLLDNDGANLSDRLLDKIISEFRAEPGVVESLVQRKSLPITIVERLVNEASDAISAELKKKYNLTDEQLHKDTVGSRDDVMLRMLRHDLTDEDAKALVSQMASTQRLTPSLIMTALCRGQLLFFTAALAHFAGIPLANARKLISDRGEHGFRGLYAKSGLPDSMFAAIHQILIVVRDMQDGDAIPGSLLYANGLVERVLATAGGKEIEYLPYFIALIRQNVQKH